MIVAPFRVVLDANVLFPFTLRDTLLRAADAGLFQLYWSDTILDETTRNLVSTGRTTQEQADRLRAAMVDAFPEAMVTGHEPLIEAMPNHPKDRHVVAAAVKAAAQVIVTSNLGDFDQLPDGIEAQSPDETQAARRILVPMDETDFEGTLVLEQLAAIGKVEDFFDAIDADDVQRAASLMRRAKIDSATIALVVRKIEEGDADH